MVDAGKNHPLHGKKFNPEGSLYIMPETTIKQIMKEKLGELISLDIDKITISEFNTRCQFVDNEHVETLMKSIEQHGYIPKSAVWINALKGSDGKILTYRLVAGRHRYEATKKLNSKEIPSQLYYNLTDAEECELDDIDNKLDEHHKPINFLHTAEHYKYLRDVKKWSQRQIAKAKNVSKTSVVYRLKIADLSKDVKELIMGGQHVDHLVERHVIEICKLTSKPHHILVCKEIISSKLSPEDGHKKFPELKNIPTSPMTQKDIEARVEELLKIEKEGKVSPEAQQFVDSDSPTIRDEKDVIIFEEKNETSEDLQTEQLEFDIFSELSEYREYEGLKFSILPLWIRHTDLIKNMCNSSYLLLNELITYDFRYKPEKDKYFFIKHGIKYDKCDDFLSHMAGVKPKTLYKKILPGLKDYVNYRKTDTTIKFQLQWNRLYEVYEKYAKEIPFDDGGLHGIPPNFTGWLRPTPYHGIYIEKGQIKRYENLGKEVKQKKQQQQEKTKTIKHTSTDTPVTRTTQEYTSPLAQKLKELGMAEAQIELCLQKKEKTEDVLKHLNEMPPAEKNMIKNIPGFIYKLVITEFKPPEGFISAKAAEDKKEKRKTVEDLAALIEEKFRNKEITHFTPKKGIKYPISVIPNNATFLYKKNDGVPIAGLFAEWADEKFFC